LQSSNPTVRYSEHTRALINYLYYGCTLCYSSPIYYGRREVTMATASWFLYVLRGPHSPRRGTSIWYNIVKECEVTLQSIQTYCLYSDWFYALAFCWKVFSPPATNRTRRSTFTTFAWNSGSCSDAIYTRSDRKNHVSLATTCQTGSPNHKVWQR
jgi:hypothetical protein